MDIIMESSNKYWNNSCKHTITCFFINQNYNNYGVRNGGKKNYSIFKVNFKPLNFYDVC